MTPELIDTKGHFEQGEAKKVGDCEYCRQKVEPETTHRAVKYGTCDVLDEKGKVLYRQYLRSDREVKDEDGNRSA